MNKFSRTIDELESNLALAKKCLANQIEGERSEGAQDAELIEIFSNEIDALRVALAALYAAARQEK